MKYITVSLVSVLGSLVGSGAYSSGPKNDPRVQNIFMQMFPFPLTQEEHVTVSVTGGKNTGKVPSQIR